MEEKSARMGEKSMIVDDNGVNIYRQVPNTIVKLLRSTPGDGDVLALESLSLKDAETPPGTAEKSQISLYKYPKMTKTQGDFTLSVAEGEFVSSQIIVLLGDNRTGKTTFIRMLAGLLEPDNIEVGSNADSPTFNVSYLPQGINPNFTSTVGALLHQEICDAYTDPEFTLDVMRPLLIEELMDRVVSGLSSGEMYRVALCLCLGKPADIYLIDERSAFVDSEKQCDDAAKVIKNFIHKVKKPAFVVEQDSTLATYLADRVIVFEGEPSVECAATCPESLPLGINIYLKNLEISGKDQLKKLKNKLKLEDMQQMKNVYYLSD